MPQACNFIKKVSLAQVFSCEFCGIFKNTFFTEHIRTILSILKFEFVSSDQVLNYINDIDRNKSSGGDIPAKIIKMVKDQRAVPIINCIKIIIFHQALFRMNLKFLTSQSTNTVRHN